MSFFQAINCMSDLNNPPFPFTIPQEQMNESVADPLDFPVMNNLELSAESMVAASSSDSIPFNLSLVDPALLEVSGLTPPPAQTLAEALPLYPPSPMSIINDGNPVGWTSATITPDKLPLFKNLPDEMKLNIINKAIDEITTCTITVKRMVKLDTGKRELVVREKGEPVRKISRQWIFTYRMSTLQSESALLNVDTLCRKAYQKRKPNLLSFMTSAKKELASPIHFSNEDEVVIDNESIFYIHHYLQRLRPAGGLKRAVSGWNNIKKLVIEAGTIKIDIEFIQDEFMRQIGSLEDQRRAALTPEDRRQAQFPEGWFACREFEMAKIEHHGKTVGVIFELLKKMVLENGGTIWLCQ